MKASIPPVLMTFALLCFALVQNTQAVSPPPDGGYPGGNTAEGQNALRSTTTGGYNAAVGYFSLFANTTGSFNTAVGAAALDLNTAGFTTAVSSRRYKEDIKPMDKASEALLALKPVTFR